MELTINQIRNNKTNNYQPKFKGILDAPLTSVLRVLDSNEMANAAVLDLGTMVAPRTYFDSKERNKYAGAETFIREICGTFINCFSAGIFGGLIAKAVVKHIDKNVNINPKSWFSNDSLNVLKSAWDGSQNNTYNYVKNVLNGISAKDGLKTVKFSDINWDKTQWFEEDKWLKYRWDNPVYANLHNKLKTADSIIKHTASLIDDKNLTVHDKKQAFGIIESRITNGLKANKDIEVKSGKYTLSTNLTNLIRDIYDLGNDVFTNPKVDIQGALNKIRKVNNAKIFGALALASGVGISVQRLNRKLTEKRTGQKGFVGEVDYLDRVNKANSQTASVESNDKNKTLWAKKILASVGMAMMVMGVMKVKNPADFVKKLQFTGPVSTGNAIKTVYMSTIIGRFLAADSDNELRETVVRDYFGFLNWLVLGGFAAKGVANILDPKKENLFNIKKDGKGIMHWLNDLSLKTHTEIASKGAEFAKKNIWKLNLSHIVGLAYSTIMLGIVLPKINIYMTKHKAEKENKSEKS